MEKNVIIGIMILLVLCSCAQEPFAIEDEAFEQEQMAHAATMGTMYLANTLRSGNHNCDDKPSTCCASGYHMCTTTEFLYGGRELEFSGTNRLTNPYNVNGDVDPVADSSSVDCTGWSATSGTRFFCSYSTTLSCSTNVCTIGSYRTWCCSR